MFVPRRVNVCSQFAQTIWIQFVWQPIILAAHLLIQFLSKTTWCPLDNLGHVCPICKETFWNKHSFSPERYRTLSASHSRLHEKQTHTWIHIQMAQACPSHVETMWSNETYLDSRYVIGFCMQLCTTSCSNIAFIWFKPHPHRPTSQERCFHDFHKKNNMILEAGCSNVDAKISLIPQESKKEPRLNMHYRSTNAGCVMQSCKKTSNTTLLRDLKSKTHWHVLDVVGILGSLWNSLQGSCFRDPNSRNPSNYLMFCLFWYELPPQRKRRFMSKNKSVRNCSN